jgi:NAD(P)-dependent dehydrogenase (short-subunit alcohol dehydrogenase family)
MHINDQIVLISGGASGMGEETARHLAKLGAKVVVLDQNFVLAKKIADEVAGLAITCDIVEEKAVISAFAQIETKLGIPRICINCAGIAPGKLVVDKHHDPMPLHDFSRVIEVNLIGTFNMLRVAAARMSTLDLMSDSQERGVIINTASIAAFEGQVGQIAYSASKGGVVAMTLPAARELARYGIRVLTIAPGLIETPLLYGLPQKVRESLAGSIPFPKRFGKPSEYASLVVHMIENEMLNGTTVRLDGALRMPPA